MAQRSTDHDSKLLRSQVVTCSKNNFVLLSNDSKIDYQNTSLNMSHAICQIWVQYDRKGVDSLRAWLYMCNKHVKSIRTRKMQNKYDRHTAAIWAVKNSM